MFVFRGGERPSEMSSPEAMQEHMAEWKVWMDALAADGTLLAGEPLTNEGYVIDGSIVTDGPFAEGKELVGGYLLIDANDFAAANEVGKGCPILKTGGTVEVRQIVDLTQQ